MRICLLAIVIKQAIEMLEQECEGIIETLKVEITQDPRITRLAIGYKKHTERLRNQYDRDIQLLYTKYKRKRHQKEKEETLKHAAKIKKLLAKVKEMEIENRNQRHKEVLKFKMESDELKRKMLTSKRRTQEYYETRVSDISKKYDLTNEDELKKFMAKKEELESDKDLYFHYYDQKYETQVSKSRKELLRSLIRSSKEFYRLAQSTENKIEFSLEESVSKKLKEDYDKLKIHVAAKYWEKEEHARNQLKHRVFGIVFDHLETNCRRFKCYNDRKLDVLYEISQIILKDMDRDFDLSSKIPNPDILNEVTDILKNYAESFHNLFREDDAEETTSLKYWMMKMVEHGLHNDFDKHSHRYSFSCKERYKDESEEFIHLCHEYQLAVKILTGVQRCDIWRSLKRYHAFV